jgi:hypothetical protein
VAVSHCMILNTSWLPIAARVALSCVKELAGFDLDLAGAQYIYV